MLDDDAVVVVAAAVASSYRMVFLRERETSCIGCIVFRHEEREWMSRFASSPHDWWLCRGVWFHSYEQLVSLRRLISIRESEAAIFCVSHQKTWDHLDFLVPVEPTSFRSFFSIPFHLGLEDNIIVSVMFELNDLSSCWYWITFEKKKRSKTNVMNESLVITTCFTTRLLMAKHYKCNCRSSENLTLFLSVSVWHQQQKHLANGLSCHWFGMELCRVELSWMREMWSPMAKLPSNERMVPLPTLVMMMMVQSSRRWRSSERETIARP